jgi:hypothetical protein
MAYKPLTYRDQGGDRQVVASGGTLLAESGATVTYASGSTVNHAGTLQVGGTTVGATAAELNDNDLSARTQAITAAVAIDLDARYVTIVGPASSTYAVTLAAPGRAGILKVINMLSTTSTNSVTLALTNVAGGTAATTATFDAAAEVLVLVSGATKWLVLAEVGVTLS